MGNQQSQRINERRRPRGDKELLPRSNVFEYTLEKITEDIRDHCTFNDTEAVDRGRRRLEEVYEVHRKLLDYNAQRETAKLEVVIGAMERNKIRLSEEMIGRDDGERRALEEHRKAMDLLDEREKERRKFFAECLVETSSQIAQYKLVSIEEKARIREARERDVVEEEYQRKVADIRVQMARIGSVKEKLEAVRSVEKLQEFHKIYLDHLLEKIRLCLVILEKDLQDLSQYKEAFTEEHVAIGKRLLASINEGNEAISTITVLETDDDPDVVRIRGELQKLIGSIGELEAVEIPEATVHHHLRKLLETRKKFILKDNVEILLGCLVVVLVYVWMNV